MPVYSIKIELTEPLLGTVPKDREVYASYIETKKPETIGEDESLTVEEIEEKGWTGFHRDEDGPFLYDYSVLGFLKEAGNVLKENLGIKALRNKIESNIIVTPRRIRLPESAGVLERPLRAQTAQGPRVALARSDYVEAGTVLEFTLDVLKHKELKEDILREVLSYGRRKGLGQWRNGGYGRFNVLEMKEIG